MAEDLEKRLLTVAQSDDPKTADDLLGQDEDVKKQRESLKKQKDRVAGALNSINKFAPNTVARPREKKKEYAAPEAPKTQDLAGGNRLAQQVQQQQPQQPPSQPSNVPGGQLIESFAFTSNGDNGGFVYWLGTSGKRERFANPHDNGRLRMTSSGLAAGSEALLVARKRQPCWTTDTPDAWMCVDLGRNRALAPTHYTLCNGSPDTGFDLLSWALEAYDPHSDVWVDLAAQTVVQRSLPSPWGVQTFPLDHKNKAWRYLRIRHTGLNSRGTREMPICAWEFYGNLYATQPN